MTRKIAIVGAGPSGCYLAQALLKLDATLEIDIIDRLPVPYGLVRYGVAPDHQGTKAVTRQFARLFERQGVNFIGNLDLCSAAQDGDISLDALRAIYDVVVLATGLPTDQRLGIPGEHLTGVVGSGALTRAWNDHPDSADTPLPDPGRNVAIIGNGNVAMDVLRILSKTGQEFDGSDFGPHHADQIAGAGITRIEVIGRSAPQLARFDPVMVREIGKSAGLAFEIHDLDRHGADAADDPRVEALASLAARAPGTPRCTIAFRFGWSPVRFDGADGRLAAVDIARADGSDTLTLPCDMAVTAIGFQDDTRLARPDLVAAAPDIDAGRLDTGLYATGWFRRGPRGTIPDNRSDSQTVAAAIVHDLAALPAREAPGRGALLDRFDHLTDYAGWQRIDEHERASCDAGRLRAKMRTRQDMLKLALNVTETTK